VSYSNLDRNLALLRLQGIKLDAPSLVLPTVRRHLQRSWQRPGIPHMLRQLLVALCLLATPALAQRTCNSVKSGLWTDNNVRPCSALPCLNWSVL
jgi:hypothetical protein